LKVYWDTSAAINALVSKVVWDRLSENENFSRVHLACEFFAIMTGRGIQVDREGTRLVMSAKEAAMWLREFSKKVKVVEIDMPEMLDALDSASEKGVQGGRVYDYTHAMAAKKCGAEIILTRNAKDFEGLTAAKVEWP